MKKRLMNNIGLKILAFLSAVLLWFVVVNIDDPVSDQTYANIPVTVVNEQVLADNKQTYQIVNDTQTISVNVVARRSVLDKIKAADIKATADMNELTLKTQIPIKIAIDGFDYKRVSALPKNLLIRLEKETSRQFPITPTTTGTVRDGYVLGEIKADPEKVVIMGPESVVNRINRVSAEVSVSGLAEDAVLQTSMVLYDSDNHEIDQTRLANNLGSKGVSVTAKLLPTTRVPVEFDTSGIKAAEGYSFKEIKYEPKEIQIAGDKSALGGISVIHVPEEALEMTGVSEKTEKMVDITPYLPEDVQLADENANTVIVTILVEKDGTKTYEMTVAAITVNNLSDKLTLTYDTAESMEVQISGSKENLAALTLENIKAAIDLKEFTEPGTYDVPVKIELPQGCTLMKEMKVKVILEDKEKK